MKCCHTSSQETQLSSNTMTWLKGSLEQASSALSALEAIRANARSRYQDERAKLSGYAIGILARSEALRRSLAEAELNLHLLPRTQVLGVYSDEVLRNTLRQSVAQNERLCSIAMELMRHLSTEQASATTSKQGGSCCRSTGRTGNSTDACCAR